MVPDLMDLQKRIATQAEVEAIRASCRVTQRRLREAVVRSSVQCIAGQSGCRTGPRIEPTSFRGRLGGTGYGIVQSDEARSVRSLGCGQK
jgi:hypothetical protein